MQIGELLRPDISDVRERWNAFWNGDSIRPLVWAYCPKDGSDIQEKISALHPGYPVRPTSDFRKIAQNVLELMTTCYDFVGDEVPSFNPSFGPDQFSAFLGVKIEYSESSAGTNWSVPLGKELEEILPITVDDCDPMYKAMQSYFKELADASQGRFIASGLDCHSNFDCLAAMRGVEEVCIDILEKPELVKQAMDQAVEAFKVLYNKFYELSSMANTGSSCWLDAYHPGKYLCLACDFICLLSPAQAREFVMPALEEEASILDQAIFHLDGPGALKHLDDILSIDKIKAIQWVPGAGNPDHGPAWFDVYRKVLSKGKGLHIYGDPSVVRLIHKELKNPNVIYQISSSRREIEDLLDWLTNN